MAELNRETVDRTPPATPAGDGLVRWYQKSTLRAAAIDDVVYLAKLPGGCRVSWIRIDNGALGAGSSVQVGWKNDAETNATGFIASQATAAAGNGGGFIAPKVFEEDTYVIATVKGGAATGDLELQVDYTYLGHR